MTYRLRGSRLGIYLERFASTGPCFILLRRRAHSAVLRPPRCSLVSPSRRVAIARLVSSRTDLFPLLPAPGADDDLSGTASILEAFRALAQHGFVPSRGPVEFHWYAAEEAGLLGSKEIVSEYKQLGRKVGGMMNFVSLP